MRKVYFDPNGVKHYSAPRVFNAADDKQYVPPTDEVLIANGWTITEEIVPIPEPYLPTIEELTEQKLRERYSINQEFEVQRKRDTDQQGFAAYYDYVEECIAWAKSQPHKD